MFLGRVLPIIDPLTNESAIDGSQVTGWTPLMFAVKENRSSIIERLLDLGCDPNQLNQVGDDSK